MINLWKTTKTIWLSNLKSTHLCLELLRLLILVNDCIFQINIEILMFLKRKQKMKNLTGLVPLNQKSILESRLNQNTWSQNEIIPSKITQRRNLRQLFSVLLSLPSINFRPRMFQSRILLNSHLHENRTNYFDKYWMNQ